MNDNNLQITLCSICGSTDILENYPEEGLSICADCGGKVAIVPLKVIQEEKVDKLLSKDHVCPSCHKKSSNENQDINERRFFFEIEATLILKCSVCGALDGYRFLPFIMADDEEVSDNSFGSLEITLAQQEGHHIFLATAAEKLSKELSNQQKNPLVICQRKLDLILEQKCAKLGALGVGFQTLTLAKIIASHYIIKKRLVSDKQLEYLISAAINLSQDRLSKAGKLSSRVSERKISELFDANRVTTRKWKEELQEK